MGSVAAAYRGRGVSLGGVEASGETMRSACWGVPALLFVFSSTPGLAEDCEAPCAGYWVSAELANDWLFSTDVEDARTNSFEPSVEIELFAIPFDWLKVVSTIVTEPVGEGDGAPIENIGTYVSALYAEADAGPVTLRLGKFDPVFGLATDVMPGLHATDLVDNYKAEERWAGEVVLPFDAFGLSHALTASVFTTDRTVLSESLFTNRGRLSLEDGGAGNTTGVSSFSAVLDGCRGAEASECYDEGDFGYRFGMRYQRAGEEGEGDELALLAAAHASAEVGDMTLRLLGEAAYVRNLDASADDALIGTISAALESGRMTYSVAYSQQLNLVDGDSNTHEHLLDLSAVYEFSEDHSFFGETWSLGGGYSFGRNDEGENSHMIGAKLTVEFGGHTGAAAEDLGN